MAKVFALSSFYGFLLGLLSMSSRTEAFLPHFRR